MEVPESNQQNVKRIVDRRFILDVKFANYI
jgi:hypothetical protein